MQYRLAHSWSAEVQELGNAVILERVAHPPITEPDAVHVGRLLGARHDLAPSRPAAEVFDVISEVFARHYLSRYLGHSLAYGVEVISAAAVTDLMGRITASIPPGARWLCTEHTGRGLASPTDLPDHVRLTASIRHERTYEFCLAGVVEEATLLFYVWEED